MAKLSIERRIERIEGLRAVEANEADAAELLNEDVLIGHGGFSR